MARRLATEEGMFAGISSGAARDTILLLASCWLYTAAHVVTLAGCCQRSAQTRMSC